MSEKQAFSERLAARARSYFPDLPKEPVRVEMVSSELRRASRLYRFSLHARNERRDVVVKVPLYRGPRGGEIELYARPRPGRPRVAPRTDAHVKAAMEYDALSLIHAHFTALGDARFGTVRPLDFIAERSAIAMDEVKGRRLDQLVGRSSRLHPLPPYRGYDLDVCFRNAGAWLRAYQAMPKDDGVEVRQATRADFVESARQFGRYLADVLGDREFFDRIVADAARIAGQVLPDALPLGLGHGDYAMRNVLVGESHRVTVFDVLARWRAPIYEDVAYFLIDLQSSWPQILSLGLVTSRARLERYEREFLAGYFGDEPIPLREIRLFETLVLLDKWVARMARLRRPRGPVKAVTVRVMVLLMKRSFKKSAARLLEAAEPG